MDSKSGVLTAILLPRKFWILWMFVQVYWIRQDVDVGLTSRSSPEYLRSGIDKHCDLSQGFLLHQAEMGMWVIDGNSIQILKAMHSLCTGIHVSVDILRLFCCTIMDLHHYKRSSSAPRIPSPPSLDIAFLSRPWIPATPPLARKEIHKPILRQGAHRTSSLPLSLFPYHRPNLSPLVAVEATWSP